MLSALFDSRKRKDLLTVFSTSALGTTPANLLDTIRTPGIEYLSGSDLLRNGWWMAQVAKATENEQHLLTKTKEDLRKVAEQHHIIIAVDTRRRHTVVGCIALWQLTERKAEELAAFGLLPKEELWYELGTLWVKPDYRFHGTRHMPIADALYRRCLANNQDKNILATTTNLAAIHLGMRHGMQMISFASLSKEVHCATCVCPEDKTGVKDNMRCKLKNNQCRVRVPFPTWQRMGKPNRLFDLRIIKSS